MLARNARTPRLRATDSDCLLSWLEGDDDFVGTATVGSYPNKGALGDTSDLKLECDDSKVRPCSLSPFPGRFPIFKPDLGPTGLQHGLSTAETTAAEVAEGTIETWVKLDAAPDYSFFLHKLYFTDAGGPWSYPFMSVGIGIDNSGRFNAWYTSGGSEITLVPAITTPQYGVWYHLAMTWKAGDPVQVYVDGVLVHTTAAVPSIDYGTHGRWGVGGRGGRGSGGAQLGAQGTYGLLAGVRVHQVARSAAWMLETFKLGAGRL